MYPYGSSAPCYGVPATAPPCQGTPPFQGPSPPAYSTNYSPQYIPHYNPHHHHHHRPHGLMHHVHGHQQYHHHDKNSRSIDNLRAIDLATTPQLNSLRLLQYQEMQTYVKPHNLNYMQKTCCNRKEII
uniref:Uncharacterized protein n=1 Tax=Glossina pallidipes TaxID=7398 RepID=A0A1A9ZAQ0_GLOPL